MSSKSDYTAEEWAVLVRAPILSGMSLTIADPGGPIEAMKEVMAAMKIMTSPESDAELVVAVSQEAQAMVKERKNPVGDFKPDPARAGEQVLEELRGVDKLLKAKATPGEAAAFRNWLVGAAQAAADAAKEGGFLGFGAERVSEGEQRMLDQVRAALGVTAGGTDELPRESQGALEGGVPTVDHDLCTGCGICADICPDVFEIGDDGLSHVIDPDACVDAGCCEEAVEECPEGAISI